MARTSTPPPQTLAAWRPYFIAPEKTVARVPFANPPHPVTFERARVVMYGVPFDDTATFGKGASRGPEALRHVSSHQIETYVIDEGLDIFDHAPILDMGDLKLEHRLSEADRALLQDEAATPGKRAGALKRLDRVMAELDILRDWTGWLRREGKIPFLLGGEHTLSYWPLAALAGEEPVVLHFDAHRDTKAEYLGMSMSHTTPMYHVLAEHGPKLDFVQIGIRQADKAEQDFAAAAGVTTFYPHDVRSKPRRVHDWIRRKTRGRAVYVTFDIDALDIAWTPCTGTPEPFGLTPEEVVALLRAVHPSAHLIGADMMEVAVRRDDYREAAVAVQLMLRLLARAYVRA